MSVESAIRCPAAAGGAGSRADGMGGSEPSFSGCVECGKSVLGICGCCADIVKGM